MKRLLKIFILITILGGIAFFLMYQYIAAYSKNAKPEKSDVILVLGCQIWGRSPSWSLEYRLKKALDLYNQKYGEYLIVSGGQGKDEETFEATVMKEWLVKNGVDESKIIEENKSTSTFENIKYSKDIIDEKNSKSAVIVTNDFHVFRSVKIAKKLGIEATCAPAESVKHLKAYYIGREVLSLVKTYLFDF